MSPLLLPCHPALDAGSRNTYYQNVKDYYVYILASKRNGTLYVGVTDNLQRRVYEHINELLEGFTQKYNVYSLVYFEIYRDINVAILREKRLKRWKRRWKLRLIESKNPDWRDFYKELL